MSKIWLCSDMHFGHQKEFLWGPRGFNSSEEHDAYVIDNWNKTVDPLDIVYCLGDYMLNDNEHGIACMQMLNGVKYIIFGNHDTDVRKGLLEDCDDTIILGYAGMLKYEGWHFYLSHYPTITSNFDDNDRPLKSRVINLCGHTHTNDRFADMGKGIIYHCELDAHNNRPVAIDEVISDLITYHKRRDVTVCG